MAYLSFSTKGQQLGRRVLNGTAIIGRAPDCDISVRDILLSRHHCKLELNGSTWTLVDLESKNGTHIDGQPVARHPLLDGDTFAIGQTVVKFRGSQLSYKPADSEKPIGVSRRPADPWEALEGTVCGFDFNAGRIDVQRVGRTTSQRSLSQFPKPQPSPAEPSAYEQDDLYSMLTEIASSSWDSIYSDASRPSPVRQPPRPAVHTRHPRSINIQQDLLAQATEQILRQADKSNAEKLRAETPPPALRRRWGRNVFRVLKSFSSVGQWLLLFGAIIRFVTPAL